MIYKYLMGNILKENKEKSKSYKKFEYYMFEMEDKPSKVIFKLIDPGLFDTLSEEEKKTTQAVLMASLEKKFDRRWLWGLEELGTEEAYDFLMNLYTNEEIVYIKTRYANSLIWMNKDTPILEFVQEVLKSEESEETRLSALNVLYPLYDYDFKDEKRYQTYLSILFTAMTDDSKKIRLSAYDMLKDHYRMKEFTPNDDSVFRVISVEHRKEKYENAVHFLKERIRSIEVVPLSRKMIAKWIKTLPNNPPSIKVADCKICSTIPESVDADIAKGESLNEYTTQLETVVRFAYYSNKLMRCPECGRLYIYKYDYEFLVGGSEEDEYLWRSDTDGALELVDSFLKYHKFMKIITCGNFMKISY
jgi:uncharacterized protein with PIN domain